MIDNTIYSLSKTSSYEFLSYIHENEKAKTLLVKENNTGLRVALKIIKPITFTNPILKRLILREIEFLNKLSNQENVLAPYVIDETNENELFYTMPYCNYPSLAEILQEKNLNTLKNKYNLKSIKYYKLLKSKDNIDIKVNFLILLAETLQELSKNLIVHANLAPENILIDEKGKLYLKGFEFAFDLEGKINDFGYEKYYKDEYKSTIKNNYYSYHALELLKGKKNIFAADIFSFGIIMYQLLHSLPRSPIWGREIIETVKKIEKIHKNIVIKNNNIDKRLASIIKRACETEVKDRYARFNILKSDLTRYKNNYPVSTYNENVFQRLFYFYKKNVLTCTSAIVFLLIFVFSSLFFVIMNRQKSINIMISLRAGKEKQEKIKKKLEEKKKKNEKARVRQKVYKEVNQILSESSIQVFRYQEFKNRINKNLKRLEFLANKYDVKKAFDRLSRIYYDQALRAWSGQPVAITIKNGHTMHHHQKVRYMYEKSCKYRKKYIKILKKENIWYMYYMSTLATTYAISLADKRKAIEVLKDIESYPYKDKDPFFPVVKILKLFLVYEDKGKCVPPKLVKPYLDQVLAQKLKLTLYSVAENLFEYLKMADRSRNINYVEFYVNYTESILNCWATVDRFSEDYTTIFYLGYAYYLRGKNVQRDGKVKFDDYVKAKKYLKTYSSISFAPQGDKLRIKSKKYLEKIQEYIISSGYKEPKEKYYDPFKYRVMNRHGRAVYIPINSLRFKKKKY